MMGNFAKRKQNSKEEKESNKRGKNSIIFDDTKNKGGKLQKIKKKKAKYFQKLDPFLIAYLSEFLQIPNNLKLLKVNAKFRFSLLKYNELLRTFSILKRILIKRELALPQIVNLIRDQYASQFTFLEFKELIGSTLYYISKYSSVYLYNRDYLKVAINHIFPYYKISSSVNFHIDILTTGSAKLVVNSFSQGKTFNKVILSQVDLINEPSMIILKHLINKCEISILKLEGITIYSTIENKRNLLEDEFTKIQWTTYKNKFNKILKLLKNCRQISCISFKYFSFKSENIKNLANLIKKNTTIKELKFKSCEFEEGDYFLHDYLGYNKTIEKLTFSDCFTNFYLHSFIKQLGCDSQIKRINTTLKNLSLIKHSFNLRSMEYIANILKNNETLLFLNLSSNEITDSMLRPLSDALTKNDTLLSLALNENLINAEGMSILCQGLMENKTLESLHLLYNTIGLDCFDDVILLLTYNSTLTLDYYFFPWPNEFTDELNDISLALEYKSINKTQLKSIILN